MKIFNTSALKTISGIFLLATLTGACGESNAGSKDQVAVTQPEVDLQTAVISGNLEAVRQHIKGGADLNGKDAFSGSSPLITAATFDKPKIAKALIDAGADLSVKNNDGSTALHAAAFFCRVEIVQLLIDAGADKTTLNNFGATAIETVSGPFEDVKPIYEMLQQQLQPMGMPLDIADVEKTRPVIVMMLQ
ncbi:MAG: ankyrin repeat domain-containing protein [Robiginitalea sp.]|uniref:ankyrin repeat domain-containing protein n=1 Tax=Robiginitalea sp. TaxID=1902411 RepID=UPI003C75B1B6